VETIKEDSGEQFPSGEKWEKENGFPERGLGGKRLLKRFRMRE